VGQSTSGSLPLVAGEAARRRGLGCSTLRAARKVQPGVGLTQTQFAIRQKEEPDTHALRVGLASLGERSSALEVHYGAASKHQLGRGLAQTQFPKKRARRELRLRVGLASCRGKRRGVMAHNVAASAHQLRMFWVQLLFIDSARRVTSPASGTLPLPPRPLGHRPPRSSR
jgi:hypothetical protein